MSDIPADFDIRERLAGIDRSIAETEELQAETRKFVAEQQKLIAEQLKLAAEAQKLGWDARFAPYLALAAVIGGLLGIATFLAHLMGR